MIQLNDILTQRGDFMIIKFKDNLPKIENSAFIAHSADIIGDVIIKNNANIWFGVVLRGDINSIYIGDNTNIQDNSVVHVDINCKTYIEEGVTVGHGCIIHGCTIKHNCLIGMGSTILNGAVIGANTIIGAGTLITQDKIIPEGVLVVGRPGKVVRNLSQEEIDSIKKSSENYIKVSKEYL